MCKIINVSNEMPKNTYWGIYPVELSLTTAAFLHAQVAEVNVLTKTCGVESETAKVLFHL